ncbi:Ig-like domain-containing protein [Arthrobacter sp.]|uniref:L,D-transpeptidase n=1 Tax=Arthrobacter sp. TaxID=1667 RepID=UPI0033936654
MTEERNKRKGLKIVLLCVIGVLLAAAAAVTAATVASPTFAAQLGRMLAVAPAERPGFSEPIAKAMSVGVSPKDKAVEVNPATVPTITAKNASIKDVVLAPAKGGDPVAGELSADGSVWKATQRLDFLTKYDFSYTLVDSAGAETVKQQGFTTVLAPNQADGWMYPLDGQHVGIAQPLEFNFSEPVLNKKKVEEAIKITTSAGQKGEFYWYSDTKARYRAAKYWEPNSTVTVDMKLFGVEFGNKMIGMNDEKITVNILDDRRAIVDNKTKTMKIYVGGKLAQTFPVTLGDANWPSSTGIHPIMDMHKSLPFNPRSIGLKPGDPDWYEPFNAKYASRLSNSGEFVHTALDPSALGVRNISHGCVGMSEAGARYFYETMRTGDIVDIRNTDGGFLDPTDGFGDWNVDWKTWTAQDKK